MRRNALQVLASNGLFYSQSEFVLSGLMIKVKPDGTGLFYLRAANADSTEPETISAAQAVFANIGVITGVLQSHGFGWILDGVDRMRALIVTADILKPIPLALFAYPASGRKFPVGRNHVDFGLAWG
jgi:hypothetical protein